MKQHEEKLEPLVVNATEAARLLGLSERTLYKLTKAGKVPHKRLGGRVLYPLDALRRFVNEIDVKN